MIALIPDWVWISGAILLLVIGTYFLNRRPWRRDTYYGDAGVHGLWPDRHDHAGESGGEGGGDGGGGGH